MSGGISAPCSLRLSAVGFCGIDASVDPEELIELSTHFPWIEWGVLLRPELPEATPRYAPRAWLQKLRDATAKRPEKVQMRLAGHLCGKAAEQLLLEKDLSLVQMVCGELGFQRIQVNPTSANGFDSGRLKTDPGFRAKAASGLEAALVALPSVEFILQRCEETEPLARYFFEEEAEGEQKGGRRRHQDYPNLAVLFDPSTGTGVLGPRPQPHPGVHCGYAGGLGPETVASELLKIQQAVKEASGATPAPSVWIDMESRIRTVSPDGKRDVFDLKKVREVLQAALGSGAFLGAPGGLLPGSSSSSSSTSGFPLGTSRL